MALSDPTLVAGGLLSAAAVLVVAAGLDMTVLVATMPAIRRRRHLTRYRRAVIRHMWAALGAVVLMIGAGGAVVVGVVGGWAPLGELPITAGAGVPLLLIELWVRYVERRVKAVPVTNPSLQNEWYEILSAWEEGAFPLW